MIRRTATVVATFALAVVAAAPALASSTVTLPAAATSSEVARLVAASTSINTVPAHLDPVIAAVTNDTNGATKYRGLQSGCRSALARCTFGDVSATRLVVLFGDSHAWMWVAAIAPEMTTAHVRLQVLWKPGCPVASVSIAPEITGETTCSSWRTAMIALITSEKPAAVIVSERTTDVLSPNAKTPLSAHNWTTGLETTLHALAHPGRSLVVVGDVPAYETIFFPASCLSQFRTSLQAKCSTTVTRTSPTWQSEGVAEAAAAKAVGAGFINPTPWLCNRNTCSIVVGTYVVYSDWVHVTATYAALLAGVMGAKLKPFVTAG